MSEKSSLTATELTAAAADFLFAGGYREVPQEVLASHSLSGARVFEDAYGVAAVVVFDAWDDVVASWPDYQGGLVDLMSSYLPGVDAKAWEGYLVLLTPGGLGAAAHDEANAIRYDMTRVRKLVGAGDELQTLADVGRVLRPLLPLQPQALATESAGALDLLPDLLDAPDLPADAIRASIEAFKQSKPVIEALYEWGAEA